MSANAQPSHPWRFFRSGGLDQVSLKSGADLAALGTLDQKLWVALSCPVKGLQLDERTLALIDSDGDGHVRAPEVIAAVSWACARLRDPGTLLNGAQSLPLGEIGTEGEGPAVAEAARWILSRLGVKATAVTAAQAAEMFKSLSVGPLKGDGILRAEAAGDDSARELIRDINDACGETTEKTVAAFFSDLAAFKAWSEAGGSTAAAGLGPAAAEAFAAVGAVRAKVEDYFARTALASFDSAAAAGLNLREEDYRAISAGELKADSPVLVAFPLSRIEPGKPLPLLEGVNPAWAAALARLHRSAVVPLLGADATFLTPDSWASLLERLKPYEAWMGTRPTSSVAKLGAERINAVLAGTGKQALEDLLAEDRALAPRVAAVADVERLALFCRDLGTLLRNFVNFLDFYSRHHSAIFQAGTLYMDARSCRLCIRVDDVAAHSLFATMSRVYVAYVECRRAGGEKTTIAVGFTQGDSDYLFVGRNGVFYDRAGRDWDATVVKVVESPISIRQSFFAPYKKVAAFVEDQFAKFAASKDQAVQGGMAAAAAAPAPAQSSSFDIAKFAGIFAAIGLAIGAIGGALASVSNGLLRLPGWERPLAAIAALLIISGPSMLLAALKLRQRNLGPLLEGTGWAVNGRVKINVPLGAALTERAVLPPGSRRLTHDPYADHAASTRRYAALVIVIAVLVWLAAARVFHLWPMDAHPAEVTGTPSTPVKSTAPQVPPAPPR